MAFLVQIGTSGLLVCFIYVLCFLKKKYEKIKNVCFGIWLHHLTPLFRLMILDLLFYNKKVETFNFHFRFEVIFVLLFFYLPLLHLPK